MLILRPADRINVSLNDSRANTDTQPEKKKKKTDERFVLEHECYIVSIFYRHVDTIIVHL